MHHAMKLQPVLLPGVAIGGAAVVATAFRVSPDHVEID